MPILVNCPRCGTLFIKKNRDICDNCYKEQIELIENIVNFANSYPENEVHISAILDKFKLPMKELEQLINACKLGQIEKPLVSNCTRCGTLMPIGCPFSPVCKKCANDMKKDILKHLSS